MFKYSVVLWLMLMMVLICACPAMPRAEQSENATEPEIAISQELLEKLAWRVALAELSQSHIDANEPDSEYFDEYLQRALECEFLESFDWGCVEFERLHDRAFQVGLSYPKYYIWVRVFQNVENPELGAPTKELDRQGVVKVAAMDKKEFSVDDMVTEEMIRAEPLRALGYSADILPDIFARTSIDYETLQNALWQLSVETEGVTMDVLCKDVKNGTVDDPGLLHDCQFIDGVLEQFTIERAELEREKPAKPRTNTAQERKAPVDAPSLRRLQRILEEDLLDECLLGEGDIDQALEYEIVYNRQSKPCSDDVDFYVWVIIYNIKQDKGSDAVHKYIAEQGLIKIDVGSGVWYPKAFNRDWYMYREFDTYKKELPRAVMQAVCEKLGINCTAPKDTPLDPDTPLAQSLAAHPPLDPDKFLNHSFGVRINEDGKLELKLMNE